uniref:Uncharacterized protein n=1 Tax=Tetraselmis sp. GSL018 TaxID=582737 RepID=A0A061R8C8_9CHLO|mmetsp:Transcript_13367/g.31645  ORF Transcript_13367/g.31645 Transcript_13367/m.31645 type:complete len:406 (+) Transcript_13367:279-1496(+)|eukprot:CAMPEP_0177589774 /NCGR_PEP_ID=MMETSP0419_2-20121207/7011_1 /TAXON_ID=582737 /ORGANISM="Tetraselmis sp., Strain GSL018" /LENGTH=405 /DNA_ID=CAMNT_0019080207 /DNA_START=33 /DNA_END=1250 /DNA_ORIENTATION=+
MNVLKDSTREVGPRSAFCLVADFKRRCSKPLYQKFRRGDANYLRTRCLETRGKPHRSRSKPKKEGISGENWNRPRKLDRNLAELDAKADAVCETFISSQVVEVDAPAVLEALRGTRFPRSNSRKSVMPEGTEYIEAFCLGLVGSRWPQVSEDTSSVEGLCRLLCRFIRGPNGPVNGDSFPFTSIQVNSKYASKRHVDANNAGYSMIIGLGDYEGGFLDVDGVGELDVKGKWHRFDGNIPHCTTPVRGAGERFSIIYFTNSSLVQADPGTVLELQRLGFNVDALEAAGGLEAEADVLARIRAADDGPARCLVVRNLTRGVFPGGEGAPAPLLEWHRGVRLFVRQHTSSAQVAWVGLCLDGRGGASDVGFVTARHADAVEPISRALRRASKGRLAVEPFEAWESRGA